MEKDGLMEFSKEISFLKDDYEQILQQHYCFLEKIKKIRNKLEHQLHGVRKIASMSGSLSLVCFTYLIEETDITIAAKEMISLVKELNIMFAKIQHLADCFACENGLNDHPYYWKLVRCNFLEFNKIYESNLIRTFGRTMLPF